MSAPKGNSFWLKRTTHGTDKKFTVDELWMAACEYFEECDNNPWTKKTWVGKASKEEEIPIQRPYTIKGLCLFLDIDEDTFSNYENKTGYEDYFGIARRIRMIIYTCKFEGAIVGAFNSNIIARDLGLADKREISGGLKIGKDLADEEYK